MLDISRLLRALDQRDNPGGVLDDGSIIRAWRKRRTEEITFFVKVSPSTTYDGRPALRLEFIDPEEDNLIRKPIPLEQLEVLGGRAKRWFGRCPQCLERCSKLYLPPGNDRFGCRRCLDLGYESSQTSHAGVRRLRNNPQLCSAIIEGPVPMTSSGHRRFWNAMRAAPWPQDKGAGGVRWERWRTHFTLELLPIPSPPSDIPATAGKGCAYREFGPEHLSKTLGGQQTGNFARNRLSTLRYLLARPPALGLGGASPSFLLSASSPKPPGSPRLGGFLFCGQRDSLGRPGPPRPSATHFGEAYAERRTTANGIG